MGPQILQTLPQTAGRNLILGGTPVQINGYGFGLLEIQQDRR